MAIQTKKQAAIPAGRYDGIIIGAEETTKVFDSAKGPEKVVEITIQPKWAHPDGETETIPVTVSFSPIINAISALSKFLVRIGKPPVYGEPWEAASIIGTEVQFVAERTDKDFVRVLKDTVRSKK